MDHTRQLINIETLLAAQDQSIGAIEKRLQELEVKNQILEKNVGDLQEQLTKSYIRIKQLTEELDAHRQRR